MYLLAHLIRSWFLKQKVFLTADLHFGHQNILEYAKRPFSSVEEMNEALVENWNSVVGPKDVVHILGDLCMGKMDDSLKMISRLNGHLYLYTGNHDRATCIYYDHKEMGIISMMLDKPEKWVKTKEKILFWEKKYLDAGIDMVFDLGREPSFSYPLGPIPLKMSHFPYTGDHSEKERYINYRPMDRGNLLLHGHVHDLWKFNGRMINVGTDVWNYRPVEIRQLVLDWWAQASEWDRCIVTGQIEKLMALGPEE